MSLYSARRRGRGSLPLLAAALAVLAGVAACDPIESFRAVRGVNKNDPDPKTAPYTESLAKGLDQPYPNLASVPQPPEVASTAAERLKLTETLTTQRTATAAGTPTPGPVPPMPALPPAVETPVPLPEAVAEGSPPAATSGTGKRPAHTGRKSNEPPEATGQVEAMTQPPAIPALPNFEAGRTPPPPGALAAVPREEPNAITPATGASAQPEAPPPVASLPPATPSPEVAAKPPPKVPPAGATVAMLDLPAGAPAVAGDDRARLDAVLTAYREKPTTLRIVAYAAAAKGSAEQLNSFRAALDRAQAVAKVLTDAGIPAAKIQTEATPAEAATPAGRVEVRLLP